MPGQVITLTGIERQKASQLRKKAEKKAAQEAKEFYNSEDGRKLGLTELPEPDVSIDDKQDRWHEIESIVNLAADANLPVPEPDQKEPPWDPAAIFYMTYKNDHALQDHFRDILAAILQSASNRRDKAYAVLRANAQRIKTSVHTDKIEAELREWADAGFEGEFPINYYTVGGEQCRKNEATDKKFQRTWPGEQVQEDQPTLPSLIKYEPVWKTASDAMRLLFQNPNSYVAGQLRAGVPAEGTELTLAKEDIGVGSREVLIAQNRTIAKMLAEDECKDCDLRVPYVQILQTLCQGILVKAAQAEGNEEDRAQYLNQWAANIGLLRELVKRYHLPATWLSELRDAIQDRAEEGYKLLKPELQNALSKDFIAFQTHEKGESRWAEIKGEGTDGGDVDHEMHDALDRDDTAVETHENDDDNSDNDEPDQELLAAKNREVSSMRASSTTLRSDGITEFGKVMFARKGWSNNYVVVNAGSMTLPVIKVMTDTQLGGFVDSWLKSFPWPSMEGMRRDNDREITVSDVFEVAKSRATLKRDEKRRRDGLEELIRKPITYFLVSWLDRGEDERQIVISRSALARVFKGGIKAVDGPQTDEAKAKRRRRQALIYNSIFNESMNPDTAKRIRKKHMASMPWLFAMKKEEKEKWRKISEKVKREETKLKAFRSDAKMKSRETRARETGKTKGSRRKNQATQYGLEAHASGSENGDSGLEHSSRGSEHSWSESEHSSSASEEQFSASENSSSGSPHGFEQSNSSSDEKETDTSDEEPRLQHRKKSRRERAGQSSSKKLSKVSSKKPQKRSK